MGINSDAANRSDRVDTFPLILSRHQHPIKFLGGLNLTTSTYETEMELLIKACKKEYRVVTILITGHAISDTTTSHFRPVVDTFKICMLYLRSLLWR
jgi:hypothetical protein